jgi:hypothetical protein
MILRLYAMWNQSKMILYILLFICVSLAIISFVGEGIYNNPNTYLSGMSPAKLKTKLEFDIWLLSYHLCLQTQLSKSLMLAFAIFQLAVPHHSYCGALQLSELFLVLCFYCFLSSQP